MKASVLLSLREKPLGFFHQCYLWDVIPRHSLDWFLSRLIFITGFILHTSRHHSWAFSNLFWGLPLRAFSPFCILIPNHSRVMGDSCILSFVSCFCCLVFLFFTTIATDLRRSFLPSVIFYLTLFPQILCMYCHNQILIRLPWELAILPWRPNKLFIWITQQSENLMFSNELHLNMWNNLINSLWWWVIK